MDKVLITKLYSPANSRLTQFKTNLSPSLNPNLRQVKKNALVRRKNLLRSPSVDFCSGSMVGSNARSPAAGEAEKVSEWHFHLCSEEEGLRGCM